MPSLIAAQLAGVKRQLADNGYRIGAIDARTDKLTGAALAAFRQRMHFSPEAGNADLFNALEVQAMKTAAPAGYTVCNDTRALLLVALAQVSGGKTAQHGWWKIARRRLRQGDHHAARRRRGLAARAEDQAAPSWQAAPRNSASRESSSTSRTVAAAPRAASAEAGFAADRSRAARAGYIARIGEHGLK